MRASVIVRSKDEAPRLRLTLASLGAQTRAAEIVVVNDGSRDDTDAVIAEAGRQMPIIHVRHETAKGRSAAANAGAARASGDILIFLDGDTLAEPRLVERHLEVHEARPDRVVRGDTRHLRCTRFFADPQTGSPMPGEETRVAKLSEPELARMRVTLADVLDDFASVEARGQVGIYPGAGPRLLYDIEMAALREHPECGVLWAAASGANQSAPAKAFADVGGFDPSITINEHRELALRLCQAGLRMATADARTYHMTHRSGWRDPLEELEWERRFYHVHPIPEVALLGVFWGSLSSPSPYPEPARITSLPQLEAAASRLGGLVGIEAVRQAHIATTMQ